MWALPAAAPTIASSTATAADAAALSGNAALRPATSCSFTLKPLCLHRHLPGSVAEVEAALAQQWAGAASATTSSSRSTATSATLRAPRGGDWTAASTSKTTASATDADIDHSIGATTTARDRADASPHQRRPVGQQQHQQLQRPWCTLRASGQFTAGQAYELLSACLPDVPRKTAAVAGTAGGSHSTSSSTSSSDGCGGGSSSARSLSTENDTPLSQPMTTQQLQQRSPRSQVEIRTPLSRGSALFDAPILGGSGSTAAAVCGAAYVNPVLGSHVILSYGEGSITVRSESPSAIVIMQEVRSSRYNIRTKCDKSHHRVHLIECICFSVARDAYILFRVLHMSRSQSALTSLTSAL